MLLRRTPKKEKRVSLKGAVQINRNSYFVYADEGGKTFLNTGEHIQKYAVKRMMLLNPSIEALLKQYKIKPEIHTKTLKELTGGHMNETCNIAEGVFSMLSEDLKRDLDKSIIKEASMLHDLGKVLIPSKILNKPAKLNVKEREIMNIHSTLGYELLKTQNLSPKTLELIRYHHQNLQHSGYPAIETTITSDIAVQIVSISDKYSALREARVYRRRLSRLESLLILYREVREGKIAPEIYNALVKYATNCDK
ncbi:HD domain-containing protein [bacterium]|nr:HD domain-containing protein [bacterium]